MVDFVVRPMATENHLKIVNDCIKVNTNNLFQSIRRILNFILKESEEKKIE